MGMCRTCNLAGIANIAGKQDQAKVLHEGCEYPSSCTCQHGTGNTWHAAPRKGEGDE